MESDLTILNSLSILTSSAATINHIASSQTHLDFTNEDTEKFHHFFWNRFFG